MKYLYILSTLFLFALVSGCTDKFEEFNTDIKNPAVVEGEALFTNACKAMSDQINNTNVNRNIFKLISQHWTETTYTDEANYDLVNRNIPANIWRYYYRRPLTDLKEAAALIDATEVLAIEEAKKQNKLQIIEILNVYMFQRLVDVFGMVPYSEALDIDNVYPKYDDGAEIYNDLFSRLDAAIAKMDASAESFGSADLYYGGDVASWIKFANTLKIKMGIALADYDEALAKKHVEEGVAGCFGSTADNCLFTYITGSPNYNPLYEDLVASERNDFVPANTIVDIMHELNDPRMESYFANPITFNFPKDDDDNNRDSIFSDTDISGLRLILADGSIEHRKTPFTMSATNDAGVSYIIGGDYGYNSPYNSYSHITEAIDGPDGATFKGIILTYGELQFYLAEAAERGYNVPKTAEEYYNEGITASFAYWGTEGVADYLASSKVAYSTAEGTWKQKIALQSWLASYTRGLIAYNTWRRLDYPIFNIPEMQESYDDIPVRFTFPINEQTLNEDNYDAASEAIGGDVVSTKVFWDKF